MSYYIFIILIFITAFQFSAWGLEGGIYFTLRNLIIVTISILFSLNIRTLIKSYNNISLVRIYFKVLFVCTFILSLLYFFGLKIDFSPLRDLVLALAVLLIGLNMNLTEQKFIRLVKIFIGLYTLAALSVVSHYSSGFVIHEQYLPVPKNQLAPVFSAAFILAVYFVFKQNGVERMYYSVLAGFLFASLLVIRGRSAIVAVLFAGIIFIFYYIRGNRYKFFIVATILAISPFIAKMFYDAMFLNYDISDMNSIGTGRVEGNLIGLNFILKYPLFGGLENTFTDVKVHNYVLVNLVSFGVFVGSIILYAYFELILSVMYSIRKNTYQYFEVGPLVMVILIIASLFEYTYPYSPGSAIYFPFFLMGQYLKQQSIK